MTKRIDIEGYELTVSDDGRVWGKSGRELKPGVLKNGYKFVVIYPNKKLNTICVHRLVAIAFLQNPNNLPCVNHKDGNKMNNNVSNLEWCTHQYNNQQAVYQGLKGDNKPVICIETGKVFISGWECSRQMNITQAGVSAACRGKIKTYKGYHFKFVENKGKFSRICLYFFANYYY